MKGTVEKHVNILAACYVTGTWLGCVCIYVSVIYQADSLRLFQIDTVNDGRAEFASRLM